MRKASLLALLVLLYGLPAPAPAGTFSAPGSTTSPNAAPVSAVVLENTLTPSEDNRPWLNDLYAWNETFDLARQEVKARETGAYCIGNGRAFALVGLLASLWTWTNLYGASYQEPDLGRMRMSITRAGIPMDLPRQQIGWVRRSGVVKVRAEGEGLAVETYDFAPAGINEDESWDNPALLIRLVHVVNTSRRTEKDLDIELKILSAWNVRLSERIDGGDLVITQKAARAKKQTHWRLGSFNPLLVRVQDNNLHYGVPKLSPGGEVWAAFFLSAAGTEEESERESNELRRTGALKLMDQTRAFYLKWFEEGAQFAGDAKIADLFEIESQIFKSQQSHTGGFSPLVGYSYTWIRDNNGPIRWFLKTGHPAEAKRAIDFFYGVASTMGSLPNSIRVDYPLDYKIKDLSGIHVEHAETPNWIVLQHWWYYLSTGDLELIRARWNYLKRCIGNQVNLGDKYLFHRDETYLWCLESRCFDHVPFPNYYLSTYAFSADSSFDIVSAGEHLAYLGKYLEMDKDVLELEKNAERVRAKAEETYWNEKAGFWFPSQSLLGPDYCAPFANILLNPLWCGYARNDLDPLGETPLALNHAWQAIQNAYPYLGRQDGFWKTTPTVDYFVGMNPGQLLYALCKARSAWAEKAYRAVLKAATPSGEFAEMYDGQYRPWNVPAWGQGTSGRVRPWEGGLNTESILEYLTGFNPDAGNNRVVLSPHMPEKMREFTASRLSVGKSLISLSLHRSGNNEWNMAVEEEKGDPLTVVLDFWPNHRQLSNVSANTTLKFEKRTGPTGVASFRCQFATELGKKQTFTVSEGAELPSGELEPPEIREYQPVPYEVSGSDILLLTTPSAVLRRYKTPLPVDFPVIAGKELLSVKKAAPSPGFLDMDLPVSPDDLSNALLGKDGKPRFKLAVFGRGSFCPGKHDFKPESFWNDERLSKVLEIFLDQGGCVWIGPSYPGREIIPGWMKKLCGGWSDGKDKDEVVLPRSPDKKTAMLLSFFGNQDSVKVGHGLIPEGDGWMAPMKLSNHPEQAAILIRKVGNGFLIRSEIDVANSTGFFKNLLKTSGLEKLKSLFENLESKSPPVIRE